MFQGNPVVQFLPAQATKHVKKIAKKLGLASLTAFVLIASNGIQAKGVAEEQAQVALSSLPKEAQQTQRMIHAGGPFPYSHKDGTVFGNRERMLPRSERGFYREYTVPTPGAKDRGTRRIICGGRQPTQPEACYYTGDHYASFKRIVQ